MTRARAQNANPAFAGAMAQLGELEDLRDLEAELELEELELEMAAEARAAGAGGGAPAGSDGGGFRRELEELEAELEAVEGKVQGQVAQDLEDLGEEMEEEMALIVRTHRSGRAYPWGDKETTLPGLVAAIWAGAVGVGGAVAALGPRERRGLGLEEARGTVFVTLAFLLVLYNAMGVQVYLKILYGNRRPEAKHIGDRMLGNTLEQAPAFLSLLWLHTAYVDTREAVVLGTVYVVFRLLYQLAYGLYGTFTVLNEVCTSPCYAVLLFFAVEVARAAAAAPGAGPPGRVWEPTGLDVLVVYPSALVLFMTVGWLLPSGIFAVSMLNRALPQKAKGD